MNLINLTTEFKVSNNQKKKFQISQSTVIVGYSLDNFNFMDEMYFKIYVNIDCKIIYLWISYLTAIPFT